MTPPSTGGKMLLHIHIILPPVTQSYLKSLVPTFCASVDLFLGKLRPLADGKTQVPLKTHIQEVTLDVISKVH